MRNTISTLISSKTSVLFFLASLFFCNVIVAQQPKPKPKFKCGTMEVVEADMKNNPALKADYESKLKDLAAYRVLHPEPKKGGSSTKKSLDPNNPVIIPVVVHIVLANPNIITDADVQGLIDSLKIGRAHV